MHISYLFDFLLKGLLQIFVPSDKFIENLYIDMII